MGGVLSAQDDNNMPALPQQHIVNVFDGQASLAAPAAAGSHAPTHVGSTKQTVAVRPTLTVQHGGVKLESAGVVALHVMANADGIVELLAPAYEHYPAEGETWPIVKAFGSAGPQSRTVAKGASAQLVRFDKPSEAVNLRNLESSCRAGSTGQGSVAWPLILVLRPGPLTGAMDATAGALANTPPDGTLMVFCTVHNNALKVERQLIAWGGNGAAFEMKEMFGIQDAQAQSLGSQEGTQQAAESQRNCVVCLTEPRNTALLPCSHFCVCYDCGLSIRLSPARNRCPLCRAEVKDLVRIEGVTVAPASPDAAETEAASPSAEAGGAAGGASLAGAASSSASSSAGLPPKCLQRLTRELKQIQEQHDQNLEHGIELSLCDEEGTDLRAWNLCIHSSGVDRDSALGKELLRWEIKAIVLEVWIPDGFPSAPPRLRVRRPCFEPGSFFAHHFGALCLEILTAQGWAPATSLLQLGIQVKNSMTQGQGTIQGIGSMGESGSGGRQAAFTVAQQIEAAHEKDWDAFRTQ
ncbi:unnamed protein product [Polarella glacialis]|uniref:RING-type E3 ubiquitin transferase n=1 Tax=Polarella glacialis TaxID=89957 RepID=A0A813DT45_POLGL|nr:unnamed protein product [Polarella glacialis]